jgi:asparagine synthase (glutamine-hydrolysing)
MCGIAGLLNKKDSSFADHALAGLRHRGPDGEGCWVSASAHTTLVHTRLAILDLSDAGRQPMLWTGGDYAGASLQPSPVPSAGPAVLVFNGEIYNYRELRIELESKGETFQGDSDTEVLLRLLVLEGVACLPKLAGMFAFCFWDDASGTALLARDPLGIKPLYYRDQEGSLSFASEFRALGREGDRTDATALRDFFLWGSVPEPATLKEAVRQIPAGHCLKWQTGSLELTDWAGNSATTNGIQQSAGQDAIRSNGFSPEIQESLETSQPLSPVMAASACLTRTALLESLRRHLVADVPIGIFLSGGIDSTVILALARHLLGPQAIIRTFSIGFHDPAFDESGLAQRTAEHFGAHHTEWKMTAEEGAAEIPEFLAAVDQPTIDGFNTWCVSRLARRGGVKVVLSGLGGDEIFAGYNSFDRVPQFHAWHRRLAPLRRIMVRLLNTRPHGTPWRRLAAFLQGSGKWLEAYHAQRGIFTPQEAAELAEALCGEIPAALDWKVDGLPGHPREIVRHLELTRYMRNQLLRDSDVFSMAHGLELRVPFVDQKFITTIQQIPTAARLRQGKQLLIDAVPEIPEWIRNQPKRGFRFPFQAWVEGQFGDLLEDARRVAPMPLRAWYRTWAVAAAMRTIR